jgi:excisionase family DNA binding protein
MISKSRSEVETRSVPAKLLRIRQVAEALSCSEWKVRQLLWGGVLPFVRIGRAHRVELSEVEAFIARNRDRCGSN